MIDSNMTSRPKLKRFSRARRALLCASTAAAVLPPAALAQEADEVKHDARLDGYENKVHVDSDTTALTWLLLVFLSMVGLGVMFKNARRTHLD